ncbi:hypothetical protein [Sansalvadorimonas verongulae]|uniref:hypothetical protein n=1 Tax=Sansalvadorimonas verongulae TaxID=2172824 RepID=UPI0012BB57A7|nr:hypothetical protein [Sansalvadorimonas verongulae]MTI13390.1 hypothetical protein [Sansalvadorimonas verongulae]
MGQATIPPEIAEFLKQQSHATLELARRVQELKEKYDEVVQENEEYRSDTEYLINRVSKLTLHDTFDSTVEIPIHLSKAWPAPGTYYSNEFSLSKGHHDHFMLALIIHNMHDGSDLEHPVTILFLGSTEMTDEQAANTHPVTFVLLHGEDARENQEKTLSPSLLGRHQDRPVIAQWNALPSQNHLYNYIQENWVRLRLTDTQSPRHRLADMIRQPNTIFLDARYRARPLSIEGHRLRLLIKESDLQSSHYKERWHHFEAEGIPLKLTSFTCPLSPDCPQGEHLVLEVQGTAPADRDFPFYSVSLAPYKLRALHPAEPEDGLITYDFQKERETAGIHIALAGLHLSDFEGYKSDGFLELIIELNKSDGKTVKDLSLTSQPSESHTNRESLTTLLNQLYTPAKTPIVGSIERTGSNQYIWSIPFMEAMVNSQLNKYTSPPMRIGPYDYTLSFLREQNSEQFSLITQASCAHSPNHTSQPDNLSAIQVFVKSTPDSTPFCTLTMPIHPGEATQWKNLLGSGLGAPISPPFWSSTGSASIKFKLSFHDQETPQQAQGSTPSSGENRTFQ